MNCFEWGKCAKIVKYKVFLFHCQGCTFMIPQTIVSSEQRFGDQLHHKCA